MRSPDGSIPAVTPKGLFIRFLPAFILPVFLFLGAVPVYAAPAGKKSAKSEAPPLAHPEKKSSSTANPTLVPLPVIEDLIAAGHLEDARTALREWDNSGKSAEEVRAVKKHLANAETAAALFKDAEGKASQAAALRGIEREKRDEIRNGYIAQGIKYLAQNEFDDSETYFQLALQIDPNCFDAKEGLNNVAEARRKAPAGEGSSSTSSVAAALLPEDQTAQPSKEDATLARAADLFRQGFQAEQTGDYDEASKLYQEVLKLFPNSEDAQRRLMAIETKRSVQLASAKPKKESQPVPDQADIALQIAPIYDEGVRAFNSKDFARAQDRFAAVLNIAPDHLPSQQYLDQCAALQTAAPAQDLDLNSSGTNRVAKALPDSSDPWGSQTVSPRVEKRLEGVPVQEKKAVAPVASAPDSGQSPAWMPEKTSEALEEIPSETVLHQTRRAPVVVAQGDTAPVSPEPQPAPVAPMSQQPSTPPPPPPPPSAPGADYSPPRTGGEQVNEMIEVGVRASQKGDILTAYEMWEKALSLDPTNPTARAFLEKYADEHAEASRRKGEDGKKREIDDRVDRVLNEKTFVLEQDTSVNINSILSTMGAIADLQIITGEGDDGDIHALRTTELTYRGFLDRVLTLNGYTWKREPGTNIIEVTRDIIQKRFPLSEAQYQALKRLAMDHLGGKETDDYSEALREVILGKVESRDIDTTIPGRKFFLSKYLLELVVRDSRHNVELVQQFLDLYNQNALTIENPPLLVETFRLPKTGGDNLARIINLRLFGNAEFKTDFKDDEPYLVYDDTSGILIIRQTPEKLQLVKRLMSDPKFLKDVTERDLKARKFTVVPSEDLRSDTPDSQLRRRKQVQFTRQVFQSLLYGSQSIEEAAAEGRVMYPDPDEGTIDVVDTPDNLKKIEEYLNGITETSNLTRVIQVRRRDVLDLALSLSGLVLNVRTTGGLGGQGLGGAAQGGRFGGGGAVGGGGLGGGGGQFGGGGGQFGGGLGGGIGQGLGGGGFGGGGLGGIGGGGFGGGGFGGGGFGGGGLGGGGFGGGFGFFGIIPVMVTGDVVTKQLVVTGFRLSDLDRVEDLVERLDVPVEQVEVEVRLVELTYDSSDALGVTMTINNLLEIDDNDEPGPGFTLADAASDFVSQPGNPAGNSLTLATLGRTTIDATLNFLSQFSDIRILTAPKLTVVSGRQGNVFLGEQIPYIESYDSITVPGSDVTNVVANTARADFGFTLDTLPTVTGDGHIEMELNPVLTVPGDRLPLPNPTTGALDPVGEPSAEERSASVRVRVNDGETLVIGGLLRRQINHDEGRTPLFGYIPGLAPLFTERSDIETTQNLLILVTARIIREE